MKITNVKMFRMSASAHMTGGTNWIFVRIDTDAGISGWGEGSLQYKDASLIAEIEDFARFLDGKDPFQIQHIWTSLYRRVTWTGGPVSMSAISAIDLALWDIKGKALGVPVYKLAGGRVRDSIQAYANGWFGGASSSAELASLAKGYADQGWKVLKFYPFIGAQVITPERIERGVEQCRAVRRAVGPGVELAIDIRARLDPWSARRVARQVEGLDLAWMEEPILFDNAAAMGAFARSVNIPIATGEQLYNRWEFEPLLEENAVAIIQPDICHAGGFSELRNIASAAETHYVSVAPHNSNGPISTVASLHLDLSIPNAFMQEIFVSFRDRYTDVLTNDIIIEDGCVAPPTGPGWGTEIDVDRLELYPPGEFVQVESEPYLEF